MIDDDKWQWWHALIAFIVVALLTALLVGLLVIVGESGPIPLEPDRVNVGFKMIPCPSGFTPPQCEKWEEMQKERRREQTELLSDINYSAQRAFDAIRGLNDSLGRITSTGLWSKVGDTLMQYVFDTVIGAGTNTLVFPISYTSGTSYRVTCSASRTTSGSLGTINTNSWAILTVSNGSTGVNFTVSNKGYTDGGGVGLIPGLNDSVTCSCVASGR